MRLFGTDMCFGGAWGWMTLFYLQASFFEVTSVSSEKEHETAVMSNDWKGLLCSIYYSKYNYSQPFSDVFISCFMVFPSAGFLA